MVMVFKIRVICFSNSNRLKCTQKDWGISCRWKCNCWSN